MSSTPLTIVFRADAGPLIGIGHVMRCLSLARALTAQGADCVFACDDTTRATVPALSDFPVMDANTHSPCDWLVVDHYRLDKAFETPARAWAKRILVIDDLADRPHDCDMLLDQTVGRDPAAYEGLLPPHARILTGSRHALLRPEFRTPGRDAGGPVLVSMGGTDPANATGLVLDALAELDRPVVVVMGSKAPHLETVKAKAARLLVDVDDMAALMRTCAVAVGAAGTSALERAALGLPTVTLVIADNQRQVAKGLESAGAALCVDLDGAAIRAAVERLLSDPGAMAARARALCDGLGADRLAQVMLDRPILLRPATMADGQALLDWRNDPLTRANSLDTAEVPRDAHFAWLERVLADPDRQLLMADRDLGMVRFDKLADGVWRVSIAVAPSWRGLGQARPLLAAAIAHHGNHPLVAEIREENQPSRRIFEACGFKLESAQDGVLRYVREAIS
jgi:UDP-2,4-diacetamido-2,4,6-trideoxy-beta-L-altropyranose hydrolase